MRSVKYRIHTSQYNKNSNFKGLLIIGQSIEFL